MTRFMAPFLVVTILLSGCAGQKAKETAKAEPAQMERIPEATRQRMPAEPQPPQAPPARKPDRPITPKKRIDPDRRESGQAQAPAVRPEQPEADRQRAETRAGNQAEAPAESKPSADRVTALKQSESTEDLNTTARIRQALIGDDQLSFRAKNVVIVTDGDQVVLQGRVASRSEAERIRDIAGRLTTKSIEDRLDVSAE
jgi:type IV secretory pathway VirB10-like protein